MTTIIHHDDCLLHDTGPINPERAQRISAVMGSLAELKGLEYLPAPLASPEQLLRVHPDHYLGDLRKSQPSQGCVAVNEADTMMSADTLQAALRGSGAICFAIEQVAAGSAPNAFCVVRPPGHHAEAETAMGYCFYNHVAVGARHAQSLDGIARVAIVDFDVHHGNGTQAIFENDGSVLFVSSHQMPLYPGTGHRDETGSGNIINLPLDPGSGGREFRRAWSAVGLPAIHSFEPDFILVSAGFDAHHRDPLAHLHLDEDDFRWISDELSDIAADCADGRLVSILEGGYDLQGLASSASAHVERLLRATHD
ncbi:MAG: histone deacetylase family protein [Xanthomonadales bacterium]|nr:histone deacetylase family protein [Xanthomonadales bacterium]